MTPTAVSGEHSRAAGPEDGRGPRSEILPGGGRASIGGRVRERVLELWDEVAVRAEEASELLAGARPRRPRQPAALAEAWPLIVVMLLLAGVAAAAALTLARPGDGTAPDGASEPAAAQLTAADAELIRGSSFTVALPAGWRETDPPAGAELSIRSADGSADATLWIERDPSLSLESFERRSLAQLASLAPDPRVSERVSGADESAWMVRMEAATPPAGGAAPYEVTLRASPERRFYLATTLPPDADPELGAAVELIHASIRPR